MSRVIDPALVRRAQGGDPQAANQVVNECESLVRYLSFRKGSQEADTEDRQQEIRLQIFRKALPGWNEEKGNAFLSWAYWWGRAKRGVIFKGDQRRPKHRSVGQYSGTGKCGDGEGDAYSNCSPQQVLSASLKSIVSAEEAAEKNESVTFLHRAIRCLSGDERLIIMLRFFEDRSIREISEMTQRGDLVFETTRMVKCSECDGTRFIPSNDRLSDCTRCDENGQVSSGYLSQTKVKTLETKALAKLGKVVTFFMGKEKEPEVQLKETFRVIKVKQIEYVDTIEGVEGS